MNNNPIGIFDSGVGGLTVVKEIEKILPNESYIYVGDTARVPYGNRSSQAVQQFSEEIVRFLNSHQVKAVVIACATASSVALDYLKTKFPQLPILGVIHSGADAAIKYSPNQKIGIIGTRATINSKSFENAIKTKNPNAKIEAIPCPLFVPFIEEGITSGTLINSIIKYYFDTNPNLKSVESLILGCTHYPLIADLIQNHLPNTNLINVGESIAHELKIILETNKLNSTSNNQNHQFFVTDLSQNFDSTAKLFLGREVSISKTDLNTPNFD